MRQILAAFLIFAAGSTCPAQSVKFLPQAKLIKPLRLGAVQWGKDDHFRLKWKHDSRGRFIWADIDRAAGQLWVASRAAPDKTLMTALDAHGESLRSFELQANFTEFKILARGRKKEPLIVGRNSFQLIAFDPAGKRQELRVPKTSPTDFEVVSKDDGRPMVVAAYHYGGAGLRAFRPDGKLLWELEDLERVYRVRLEKIGGKPVLAASSGIGKVTLVSLKGRILERIPGEGNMDRFMFDSPGKEGWLYSLDSRAGSWKETLSVRRSAPGKKKGRWEHVSSADLGRVSVTAFGLGDFEGKGRRPVLGTGNGWVLLLDRAGRVVSETRFRGKIASLDALDLNDDGKDELVVSVLGYSGNVFVFTRAGAGR